MQAVIVWRRTVAAPVEAIVGVRATPDRSVKRAGCAAYGRDIRWAEEEARSCWSGPTDCGLVPLTLTFVVKTS